jgi:glycosyltransferase involved in cell wall biosynthesis
VTSGHDVADARLHREVAAFQRAGLSVEVLGLGDPASAPPGTAVRTRPRKGLAHRAGAAVALPWRARGEVVLCLDPDLLPSASLRRLTGRRVVADVHEDYLALLDDRRWARGATGRVARVVARTATRLAARADLTVVADEHVPPAQARARLVVRNLPDTALLPAPSGRGPVPRALYVGDLRASRGLFTMLTAVEAAPGWELDLVGPVAAADQPRLEQWLATSSAADRVRLHGRLEPRAAWAVAEGAWVGLALLDSTPAFEAAVPTKLYEYLACGLGVLVTPLRRMAEIVSASSGGTVVEDAAAAAAALRDWAADPAPLDAARAAGLQWWRGQAGSPYDELARRVLALSRPGSAG